MSKWKVALEEFLKDWKDRCDVVGALVCGSYITGNPSKRSDIDVHLILSEDADWRERGNQVVHGFLIEYFVNPPRQIRKYFDEDFHSRRTMSMVQFMTGHTLFDKTGIISKLKIEAQKWLNREFGELSPILLEMKKYAIWDTLDNVKDCFEQGRLDFPFVYYNALAKLFSEYNQFLGLESIPFYQINSYLTDPTYLKKYLKKEFPDAKFQAAYVKALAELDKRKMMKTYEELAEHVLAKMGSFQIDGWKLRSAVDA